jgi:hypothetical protein
MSRRSGIRFADKDMRQHENLRRFGGNASAASPLVGARFRAAPIRTELQRPPYLLNEPGNW